MTHWWARCEHPVNCGWESPCYPTRAAAVGAAGQHMRKHDREGMAPGVRASTRVRSHGTANARAVCLGEGVLA